MVRHEEAKVALEGEIDGMVKELIHNVAAEQGIDLMECETMIDHVHVLVRAQDRAALSRAMNFIKGTSSRRLLQRVPDLKLDTGMNHFWQQRYGFKVIPEGAKASVARYIQTQKERPEKAQEVLDVIREEGEKVFREERANLPEELRGEPERPGFGGETSREIADRGELVDRDLARPVKAGEELTTAKAVEEVKALGGNKAEDIERRRRIKAGAKVERLTKRERKISVRK